MKVELTQEEFDALLPLIFEYKDASRALIQQLARKQPRPKDTANLSRWEQLDNRLHAILDTAVRRGGG